MYDSVYHMTTTVTKVSLKIVNEYDQEIPQSQTADNPEAPRGRAAQPSRDTSSNRFSYVKLL